jgi:hypothetical protein
LYDKRYDFNIPVVNFTCILSTFLHHMHTDFIYLKQHDILKSALSG